MKKILVLIISVFIGLSSNSQISEGGAPYSFTHRTPIQLDEAEIKAPTNSEIQQATLNNKSSYCVGVLKDVNLTENTAGTWVTHDDGSRSWFLKITSRDAIGLTLHYNNLFIPHGGSLFLYNENKSHVIGKFTSSRNFNNPITHTQIIEGESTIIEYHEPKETKEKFSISISQLGYIFRGFEDYLSHFKSIKVYSQTILQFF